MTYIRSLTVQELNKNTSKKKKVCICIRRDDTFIDENYNELKSGIMRD